MNKTIKGLQVKIGADTSDLGKALADVEKKSRSLSGELTQVNRLLKLDPGNTELLAQKHKILQEAVEATKEKLDKLKAAEASVQEQFEKGDISAAQYRAFKREITSTEQALKKYEDAVDDTADEMKRVEQEAQGASKSLIKMADSTEEALDATQDLNAGIGDFIKGGLMGIVGAAAAAAGALVAAAESTREYRTAMGKLNVAFEDNNFSAEAAKETYKELQSILGDTDQAVEAANHLAALVDNEEDLKKWTTICTGVFAKFGDSLPIEGLTEASNETAKTGEITGALADALNWAGESETAFQEELDKCSNEQERQQLITKTLTKLYGSAASQYKKTNKAVIEANEANEDWTETLADLGAEMDPLLTDVKKMGTSILKDMEAPLKSVIGFVRNSVFPAMAEVRKFAKDNLPAISAGVAGVTAALVAYKVATLAAEAATKGMTVATIAAEVATKALNLAQAATPWGLVAVAVTGVVAAVAAYSATAEATKEKVEHLTEAERAQIEAAREAAEAYRDQVAATTENESGILSQMQHTKDLAAELDGLVNAHGRVKEADKARVEFILGELNEALGTEYTMVGNNIQNYDELKSSIYEVIEAKQANMLLEANSADYTTALQERTGAMQGLANAEKDYQTQLGITQAAETAYEEAAALMQERMEQGYYEHKEALMAEDAIRMAELRDDWLEEQGILDEKQTARDEAAANYGVYADKIADYEEAQTAVLEGNYERAVDILTDKEQLFTDYSGTVDEETAKVLDALYQEAIDAGIEAERTRTNFENGVDGYTRQMVKEAEDAYEDAMDAFADAYADAEGVGEDVGDGLTDGMENKRQSALSKVRSIVGAIISAARQEADSHSPSRKMIAFGEDMGEGAVIGLDSKTAELEKTGREQVQAVLDAYEDAPDGQQTFRSIQTTAAQRQAQTAQAATSANATMMERILHAIEKGQVLLLDGDMLVGGTADKMDDRLGQKRALVARGAV